MTGPVRLETRDGYDRWSAIYDEEQNPLILIEEPQVRQWLSRPAGLCVADVGCGTGRHARWLAEAGARVTAFDFSPGMMERAQAKLGALGVELVVHVLPSPLPCPAETFDVVLLALVADHIAELGPLFDDLQRIARPGGQVLLTVLHPAMNLLGITARFTDPRSGEEVRVEAFEHSTADYLMAVLKSGLQIEEIVERKVDAALAARTARAEKYLGWPLLLAVRAIRR